jgi:DNA-binding HxlR family transcriptional regulator
MEPRRQKPEREYAYAQKLPTRDKFVLVALADLAKDRSVFASRNKLHEMTGISTRRITDILNRLIAGGYISRVNAARIENGMRMAADYRFTGMGDTASPVTQRHGGHSVPHMGDTASSVQVTLRPPNYKTTLRKSNDADAPAPAASQPSLPSSSPVAIPRPKPPKFDPATLSLPHGAGLANAWSEFAQHRREIKAPLTPTAAQRIVADLAAVNEAAAVEALRKSVKHGWRGVFVDAPKETAKVLHIPRTGPVQPSEAEKRMMALEALQEERMRGVA